MRFAAARTGFQFEGFNPSGAGGRGIAQAASMATAGSSFASMRARAPKYGKIGAASIQAQGMKRRAEQNMHFGVAQAGIAAGGKIQAAKTQAKYAAQAAAKKAQGSMMGGALGLIGSIGGALLSDEHTKDVITDIDDGLKMLRKLRPVEFYYNEEYTHEPWRLHYGFIAQEYERVMPNQTYFDPSLEKMCIDTNELIAVLVKAVQQLEKRLEVLER